MERGRRNTGGTTDLVHFSKDVLDKMEDALDSLIEESNARCALVIDRTGCILSYSGDFHPIGRETMGATAAGVVAALNTMVARASSPEVSVRLYGSDMDKIHFLVVADRIILCLLYSKRTTAGRIRSAAKAFSHTITPVLISKEKDATSPENLVKSVQFIEDKLNDMFKDMI